MTGEDRNVLFVTTTNLGPGSFIPAKGFWVVSCSLNLQYNDAAVYSLLCGLFFYGNLEPTRLGLNIITDLIQFNSQSPESI